MLADRGGTGLGDECASINSTRMERKSGQEVAKQTFERAVTGQQPRFEDSLYFKEWCSGRDSNP
jgi:hypothetical protein